MDERFRGYSSPEDEPKRQGGYNLNGVYYSPDGQRVGEAPKQKANVRRDPQAAQKQKAFQNYVQQGEQGQMQRRAARRQVLAIVAIALGFFAPFLLFGGLGMVQVIFGVIALIYCRKEQTAIKEGHMEEARRRAKRSNRVLVFAYSYLALLFTVQLWYIAMTSQISNIFRGFTNTGTTAETENDTPKKTPEDGALTDVDGAKVPYVEGFQSFELAGVSLTLPMSVDDFTAAGFMLKTNDDDRIDPDYNKCYAYYDPDGIYRGSLFIYNTGDSAIRPEDGIACGIVIDAGDTDDLKLLGGLSFASQPEDLGAVYGYDVSHISYGENYTEYQWYFADAGYSTSTSFEYGKDGKLDTVWIMNYASLEEQP